VATGDPDRRVGGFETGAFRARLIATATHKEGFDVLLERNAGSQARTPDLLAATQRPAAPAQFGEPSGPPAWKAIPSWSLIGTEDRVIPRALQEEMSSRAGAHITRVKAGHLSLITHPAYVTKVILAAVDAKS
jgi:pimeloyl-ACP methyl ester carboxylesterase